MEQVSGYIDHIIYLNKENSYTVLELITSEQDELICVGIMPGIDEGVNVKLNGTYVDHPSYGHQFKVSTFEEVQPEDVVSIERYLGSGAIKGVGEALARRIVKKFKEDTFKIIENEPERLVEVKGISERIAQSIATQVKEKSRMREAFIFLSQYGISNNLSVKIYVAYGDEMYAIIKENPYRLAEDISGVGFKIADDIASKIGINVDSEYRIRCGVLYVLSLAAQEGHIYLPQNVLLERTIDLLGIPAENIVEEFGNLEFNQQIIVKRMSLSAASQSESPFQSGGQSVKNDTCENGAYESEEVRIYAAMYYFAELTSARLLADLDICMDDKLWEEEKPGIERTISKIVKEQDIILDELQKEAVLEAIRHGVSVITGGPGTGKTTTINTLIRFFDERGLDILLAAPTGRAAKRMQEATGYEAKTIHRLLEVSGNSSEDERRVYFEKNDENPLEADVIIIDEMSMVDIMLMRSLLKAITVGTRLVMVGDVDQLPSVGCGQVLRDIINSQAFHVVHLEHIFRQAEESDIVVNAHKINKGQSISLGTKSKDFLFLERSDSSVIYKHMIELIKDRLPRYVEATAYDIQVLTPMKKGTLGVEALNPILQQYLNPPDRTKRECTIGERLFREGDKVMQTKNNYQLNWEIQGRHGIKIDEGQGVYNGDTGVIKCIDSINQIVTVMYDENKQVDYNFSGLDEIELAYAITVHKSQGSEYPAVILPILSGPRMLLNRNLLYTAVTRAKRCVTILGCRETIEQMVRNADTNQRYTSLDERIREVMHLA